MPYNPPALNLTASDCRLSASKRVKGIEPSSSAWKAVALPLSYTRLLNFEFQIADFQKLICQKSLLHPIRNLESKIQNPKSKNGGCRIRTCEGRASRFTVCPV